MWHFPQPMASLVGSLGDDRDLSSRGGGAPPLLPTCLPELLQAQKRAGFGLSTHLSLYSDHSEVECGRVGEAGLGSVSLHQGAVLVLTQPGWSLGWECHCLQRLALPVTTLAAFFSLLYHKWGSDDQVALAILDNQCH